MTGHAMWFVKRHHSKTWRVRNGVSVQFVAGSSVVLKVARNGCRVGLRLFDRLAAVAHFDLPQLVVMCEDGFRQLVQEASTFNRCKLTPCAAVRGLAGHDHGVANVFRVATSEMSKDLTIAWIKHLYGFAGAAYYTLVVDEVGCHFFPVNPAKAEIQTDMPERSRPPSA